MHIITTTSDLQQACKILSKSPFITVDTEFMRETTFWPKLCLLQMSDGINVYLVDPIEKDVDLTSLFDLMKNDSVIKVFHACRQDVEIIHHLSKGIIPRPLADTQVMAAVCGFGESISYDQLVQRITNTALDKSSRFTNWSKRPLSKEQLRYAADDVTHLIEVYHYLHEQLTNMERYEWIADEMAFLTSASTYNTEPKDAWKRIKLRIKTPIEFASLKAIAAWRDEIAQMQDVPRSRVLKDDAILALARRRPQNKAALAELRGVPRGFENSRHAASLLQKIQDVCALPKDQLPDFTPPNPQKIDFGAAPDLLRILLKSVSEKEGIAPRLIATSDELTKLLYDDEADIPLLKGWRRDIFGQSALDLKHGRLSLKLEKGRVTYDQI